MADIVVWSGSKYCRVTDDAYPPSELILLRRAVYKYQFLFCAEQLSNQKMKSIVSRFFLIKLTNVLATSAADRPLILSCQITPVALSFPFFDPPTRANFSLNTTIQYVWKRLLPSIQEVSQHHNFLHINRYNFTVASPFPILFLTISFSCFGCCFNMKFNQCNQHNQQILVFYFSHFYLVYLIHVCLICEYL